MEHIVRLLRKLEVMPLPPPPDTPHTAFRRVLFPGYSPVKSSGMVWLHHMSEEQRIGFPPGNLSQMQWIALGGANSEVEQSLQAQDWGAVLSVVLNRRVEVLDEIVMRMEGQPTGVCFPLADRADPELMAPVDRRSISDNVTEFMKKAYTLSDDHLNALSAAVRLYQASCLLYVSDLNAAYTLVIAGIERLSREFGSPPDQWDDWPEFQPWDTLFQQIELSSQQADAIRSKLLQGQHLRLQRTFVNYVTDRIPFGFWTEDVPTYIYSVDMGLGRLRGGTWEDPRPRISGSEFSEDLLVKALKGSYQNRSNYVHAGIGKVTLYSEMINNYGNKDLTWIPFAALRSALRFLILKELDDNSSPMGDMPNIWLGPAGEEPPAGVRK